MKVKQHRTLTLVDVKQAVTEYEKSLHDGQRDGHAADATEFLAGKFGLNVRHAARYLAASKLAQVLQDAVESDALPLSMAERITHLSSVTQAKIAEQVAAGEEARVVAQQHLAPKAVNPRKAFALLIGALRKCVPALRANLNKIVRYVNVEDIETLDASAALFADLRQQMKATQVERQKEQEKVATLLEKFGVNLDRYEHARDEMDDDGAAALDVSGADSRRNSID